jgi:hypothetical protein
MALVKSTNVSMSYATNRFNTLDENCFINKLPTSSQNTCSAAYSNRLVRAAYDGPIVQVRRGSDNALLDFYGDAYGLLTTRPFGSGQSLHTWLNGATGYVAKLYDQSGFEKHLSNPYIASNTSFPVSPLTGAVTNVSAAVGGGVYIVSSSGHDDFPPWRAFDNDLASISRSTENVYTITTGVYTGTASTVTMGGTTYSGEWLQIQLPVGIKLSRFDLLPRNDYATTRSPRSFVLLGSTTGEAWNLVHEETNQNNWASSVTKQFTVTSNPGAYKYYRLVVRRVGNFDNDTTFGTGNQVSFSLSDFKLIGGNTDTQPTIGNNIFPPMPMTSNTTSINDSNLTYGGGQYIASASSEFSGTYAAWKAFDYDDVAANESGWISNENGNLIYNGTTGQYAGAVTTTAGGTTYSGEWIQLQLPHRIQLTSFSIFPRNYNLELAQKRAPRSFVILGSNNGTNWTLLYEQTNTNDWIQAAKTFSVTPTSTSFNYFRMVVRRVGNFDSGVSQTSVNIAHWMLYGNNEACTDIVYNGTSNYLTTDYNIRSYPPQALTANTTAFTTVEYDNGSYIASASTEYGVGNEAWRAFDYQDSSTSFVWSSSAVWNTTTGNYSGSVTTTSLVGNVYRGEWLQLQLPNAIPITHFRITPRTEDAFTSSRRSPRSFVILGSNNGSSWTLVHEETNLTWSDSPRTFFIRQATSSFSYYRMVIREIGNDRTTTSKGTADIAGWVLYTSDLPITQFESEAFHTTFSMTSNDTTVAGLRYITSASSEHPAGPPWHAFDGDVGGTWWHSLGSWNATTGQYTGSVVTRTTNGTSYSGEWLTIQLPHPIVLNRYVILGRDGVTERCPNTFVVLGSNDGNSWNLVDQQTGIADWSSGVSKNFYTRNNINQYSYGYYRIVVSRVGNTSQTINRDTVQIGVWQMFGFKTTQKTTVFMDTKSLGGTGTQVLFEQRAGPTINNGTLGLYTQVSGPVAYFGWGNDCSIQSHISNYRRKMVLDIDHTSTTYDITFCDNGTFFKNGSGNSIAHSVGFGIFDVGAISTMQQYYFNGIINELIFFTESLRETDILTYYQTTNKKSITNYVHNPKRTVRGVLNIPNGQSLNNETFPPAAMNASTNYLTSLIYGSGQYTASASTFFTGQYPFAPYLAFDRVSSHNVYPVGYRTFWHSANSVYNSANGNYTGAVSTAGHSGEWLQLDLAFPIVLKSFNLSARNDGDIGAQCPRSFVMLGSNDATNWSLIHTETNINNWNTTIGTTEVKTFNVTNFMSFRYYRLVVKRVGNSDSSTGIAVIIGEMSLVGYSNTTMTHIPTGWRFAIDTQHLGNQSTGKPLTAWNGVAAFNSPVYYSFGGNQDFPYVNFTRGSSQYLNPGSVTLNVNSGGGFTAVAFLKFTTAANTQVSERIFDFGNAQDNNNILVYRITDNTILFYFFNNSTYYTVQSAANAIIQDEWAVWAFRYNASTRVAEIHKNGRSIASTTFGAAINDRTISNAYVGRSHWAGDSYTSMHLAGLYVYDKCLSLAEIAALSNHLVMPVRKSISNLQDLSVVKANRAAIPIGRQLGEPSMFFDGSSLNWVTIDDTPKAPFSFSFWFNGSSSGSADNMALAALASYTKAGTASTHGIEIRYTAATTITIYASLPTAWSTLTFTAARDTWHHLTITVSASNVLNAYLNGGGKQTINGTGAIPAASRFYIGSTGNEGYDAGASLKGYIQDFRVYDYVLRDDEVGNFRFGTNYPLLNTITSESGKYLVNRTNWYQKMTLTQVQGAYTAQQAESDPNVQVQMTNTQDNTNSYSQNFRIQDYRSFTCRFEIYNATTEADALFFFIGSHILPINEVDVNGGMIIAFNVYNLSNPYIKGVSITNNSGQTVAHHPWNYWVNSGTDGTTANGTHVWMPITITYSRGTESTWSICMGEREVLVYSDPNNDNWLTTSGSLWGIGARTGSGIMLSWIRGVELVYSEPRYQVPSYSNTFYVNNIVQNGLVAHFDPAIPACYPGSGATLTSLVGSVTGTLGGTYSYNSNGTIRLSNTSASNGLVNNSHLQLTSITNVTTVSIWYYQNSATPGPYLIDGRTGDGNSFLTAAGIGSVWSSGTLYKNGGGAQSITWANIETIGQWQNITVIANTPVTDNITLFARFQSWNTNAPPPVDGLDVTFGPIFVYNRAITEAENDINYNAVLRTLPVFNQIPRNPLSLSAAVADNKLVSYPNGHLYNNNVVQSGLAAYFDPANSACYAGTFNGVSSTSLRSLVGNVTGTLGGTYSYSNGTIRLTNNTNVAATNVSYLQLSSITNITTVSIWYYYNSYQQSNYLLDMRTGGSGGWIYGAADGFGSNWATGTLYKNGGNAESMSWTSIETVGVWKNITLIANTPATDDMTLFSRFSQNEGSDVTFGPILIYNRAITQAENLQNYNAIKDTIGSPYNASASSLLDLTTFNPGKLFDKSNSTSYVSQSVYNGVTGVYAGAASTTAGGVTYSGEWVQTTLNNTIRLRSYTITPRVHLAANFIENPQFSTTTTLAANFKSSYYWNSNSGWAVSASSNYPDAGYNITGAFNKSNTNDADGWLSNESNISASTPQWIQIKYPEPVSIASYSITSRNDSINTNIYFPTAFRLQGSNDGSTWVDMEANRSESTWSSNTTNSYTPRFKTAFAYFRLRIEGSRWKTGNSSRDNLFVCIGEWTLYTNLLTSLYRSPRSFVVLGSNDATTWNLIDERSSITDWFYGPKTFDVQRTPASYSYYRLVAREVGNTTNSPYDWGTNTLDIAGWELNAFPNTATIAPLIAEYPPAALTSNSTTLSGELYGNGLYVMSRSSVLTTNEPWRLMDRNLGTVFHAAGIASTIYDSGSGVYLGTTTTTSVSGTVYSGEWVQINLPQNINLSSFSITGRPSNSTIRAPRSFVILGSNNGSSWVLVHEETNVNDWVTQVSKTFTVTTNPIAYNYYRMVARIVGNPNTGSNEVFEISEWRLYGNERNTALTGTKYPPVPVNEEYPSADFKLAFRQSISVPEGTFSGTTYTFAGLGSPPDGAYNFWFIRNDGNLAWRLAGTLVISNGTFGSVVTTVSDGAIIFMSASGTNFTINPQSGVYPDTYTMSLAPQTSLAIVRNRYGNGLYTVSASSFYIDSGYRESPWQIFDNNSSTYWANLNANYSSGNYTGASSTTVQGTAYTGEWVQIEFPTPIKLDRYWMFPASTSTGSSLYYRAPRDFYLAGSNDGTNWSLLDTETNITDWTSGRFFSVSDASKSQAFTTFRLIINKNNGGDRVSLALLKIFAVPNIPGNGVGTGTYNITASSSYSSNGAHESAVRVFNGLLTDNWTIADQYYNSSTGNYTRSPATTTTVSGTVYSGEWLQIQLPSAIGLTSYSITPHQGDLPRSPRDFVIAGSNDGTNWTLVDSETDITGWTTASRSFTTTNVRRYTHFRLIATRNNGSGWLSVAEWALYDSSVSMRSIAGNTTRGFVDGLTWKFANGYHNDSATYFETTPYTQIGRSSDFTNLSTATNGRFTSGQGIDSYSIEFTGYFRAPETGTYTFFANSDNKIYVWIGSSALSGYTTGNALFSDQWDASLVTTYATISLIAGTYYPIKLLWGEDGGGQHLFFGFTTPSGVTVTDGSGYFFSSVGTNAAYPAESAKIIKALNGTNTDGVYYINVNGVSEPTYCLMNDRYDGGGWMMLMKATRGNTFQYDANYWTTANTLNATDVTRTDGDAKYNAFNYKPIKDILAIWPDISPSVYTNNFGNQGGSFFVEDGWVWELTNWNGASAATALAGFQTSRTVNPQAPAEFNGFGPMWSTQSPTAHHVIGGATHLSHAGGGMARWGFVFSDTGDYSGQGSDCFCGIGLGTVQISAGDYNNGPGSWVINYGLNRTARVEMFGR